VWGVQRPNNLKSKAATPVSMEVGKSVDPAKYEHRGFLLSEVALSVLKYAGVFFDVALPPSRRQQIRQRMVMGKD
jgi:hypothetical protein